MPAKTAAEKAAGKVAPTKSSFVKSPFVETHSSVESVVESSLSENEQAFDASASGKSAPPRAATKKQATASVKSKSAHSSSPGVKSASKASATSPEMTGAMVSPKSVASPKVKAAHAVKDLSLIAKGISKPESAQDHKSHDQGDHGSMAVSAPDKMTSQDHGASDTKAANASGSTAATRKAAAAFVAARQKMASPITPALPVDSKSSDAAKGVVEVADNKVRKTVGEQDAIKTAVAPAKVEPATAPRPAMPPRPGMPSGVPAKIAKPAPAKGQGFKTNEFIVYPSHGVGQIIAIEEQEVAGYKLELFVISFIKDKMILKVPLPKIASVGMRKLAEAPVVKRALDTLTGRARIKRTMWSRRAQEYEAKINSGDLVSIAEVVRDLYRSDAQPEQSYSERQLYEAALDRMAREISAVQKLTDQESLKLIDEQLQKGPRRGKVEESEAEDADELEEAEGGIGEAA